MGGVSTFRSKQGTGEERVAPPTAESKLCPHINQGFRRTCPRINTHPILSGYNAAIQELVCVCVWGGVWYVHMCVCICVWCVCMRVGWYDVWSSLPVCYFLLGTKPRVVLKAEQWLSCLIYATISRHLMSR